MERPESHRSEPETGMSKQIRYTVTMWELVGMTQMTLGGGASVKKMHIDFECSLLSTVKNKWTKCELFLKPDQIRETKIQNILLREMYWNQ